MPPAKYQTPSSYIGKKPAVAPAKPKPPPPPPKRLTAPTWKIPTKYTAPIKVGGQGGVAGPYTAPAATAPEVTGTDYAGASMEGFGGGGGMPYTGVSADLLQSQSAEDLGTMASGMTSKIRQALVDLGLTDTSQLTPEALKYVDAPTLAAAANNKYSLFSTLKSSAEKATAQSRAKLAASGMLSSGQLTNEANDILKQLEEKRYTGTRTFSGTVGDLLAAYAARQREWASKIAEARFMQQQFVASGGGGGIDPVTGRGYDSPERGARPGEWADLPVRVGWNPLKNSDAEYDMSGATPVPGGYLGPQGQRYDENGRVI
jgi:hypothetical protein